MSSSDSMDMVTSGLAFDEAGVFEFLRGLMASGEPVCVSSGLAGSWEDFSAVGFTAWLSADPREIAQTRQMVDEHISEMVAIRAGLETAHNRLVGKSRPSPGS